MASQQPSIKMLYRVSEPLKKGERLSPEAARSLLKEAREKRDKAITLIYRDGLIVAVKVRGESKRYRIDLAEPKGTIEEALSALAEGSKGKEIMVHATLAYDTRHKTAGLVAHEACMKLQRLCLRLNGTITGINALPVQKATTINATFAFDTRESATAFKVIATNRFGSRVQVR